MSQSIKEIQQKGFGSHGGLVNKYYGEIEPLGKRVLVEGMHFGETKTKSGLILVADDGTQAGIHPRWAKVYAIGIIDDAPIPIIPHLILSLGIYVCKFLD